MAPRSIPAIRRLQLGRALREWRNTAGLTIDQCAGDFDMSRSTLARIEKGQNTVHPMVVRGMLELYGVPEEESATLVEVAREAVRRNRNLIEGISADSYPALESEAVAVRNFELATVPGLLQTEDYARALFVVGDTRERNRNLRIRMSRGQRLFEEEPLRLHTIADELALTRPVAEPAVLAAQLRRLGELSELPHVTVQVVPTSAGTHPGLTGAFNILTFPKDTVGDLGYVDHAGGHLQLVKKAQVEELTVKFNQLAKIALGERESRDLTARLARELSS
ncbi:helix-turn-helix domain-containing protein [Amycolatopsis aidingensis]|uniref:helix-turn-helix domain-containing protein n=1 Tax=Amycolatopsis aidingensis TaxID=2842453 RepID=UPI001C0DDD3C|nr:helix-turn-helix transcriptional regulator [Amycolatopsis aidingensis]